MKYMRITAVGGNSICVQTSNNREHGYKQEHMGIKRFSEFMQKHFPSYWKQFLESDDYYYLNGCLHFFYHFGETPEMIRKGEAYIYEVEVEEA